MRRFALRLCLLLTLASAAQGQVTWDFASGAGAPTSQPATITGGTITATNATVSFNTSTSASSGYTGASGNNNAAVTCVTGALSTTTSTYFQFTLTAATNYVLSATSLSLGSRSTGTGPTTLTLYSSADSFTTPVGTATVSTGSAWALTTFPTFSLVSTASGSLTFRIYGSGGTGSAGSGNWRIDDVSLAITAAVPPPSISTQPVTQTVSSGATVSLSVTASGTGTLGYQWKRSGTNISGATSATLNLGAVTTAASGSYVVVVTDSTYGGSTTSATATLTVNPAATTLAFSNLATTYDGLPHPATVTSSPPGATVSLSYFGVGATPYGPSATAPTNPGNYVVSGTTTDSEHTGSGSASLSIAAASGAIAPSVTLAPANQSAFAGDTVTFGVTASGTPTPTFQWRKNGIAIAGATNAFFTIYGAALGDAGTYDAVIANSGGMLASSGASLTVTKKPQTISFEAPSGIFNAGTPIKLTATASSGLPVALTIVSGAGSLVGSTLTSFSTSVIVRASQTGNANFTAADSVDRTVTSVAGGTAPFLFGTPLDQTVNAGATVTLSAAAIGTPTPVWQWAKDGVALDGATKSFLTIASVTLADAARYTVSATNSVGTVSASATLTVRAAPTFTASPENQSVAAGTNVTLAATVTGFPSPALQWRKNGVAIRGAVTDKLTLVNVSAGDSARYDVVATNSLGTATSAAATVGVTMRDFSGTYFGKFPGTAGDFALYVRANGTGVFIGFLPGSKTAIVAPNFVVDLAGNFSLNVTTATSAALSEPRSAFSSDPSPLTPDPSLGVAAAPVAVTLRGTLNDATGALSAAVPELGVTLDGMRAASTGAAAAQAGYYSGALVGSADGRGYVILGADGQAFALTASSSVVDGGKGAVSADGRLALTTTNQSTLDLGFATGSLTGTVKTAGGTATLNGAGDALAGTERLANISARGGTAPGAPLIAGFVVTGTAPKQVLIRAAGPALTGGPFNVAGALDDPALQLFRGNTIIAQNDNWSTPANAAAALTAATTSVNAFVFRAGSADAALLATLAPGNYTVQISAGAASANPAGIVLAEIYEILEAAEPPGARRLANISARGPVAPGAPLIAGFVINGTAPQRVLVRGIGPALAGFGVPGALANPTLTLFRGSTTIKTNDDWFRDADAALIRDATTKTGAFALGAASLDAAILLYLDPGAYTAQVSVSGTSTPGTALVEVYDSGP